MEAEGGHPSACLKQAGGFVAAAVFELGILAPETAAGSDGSVTGAQEALALRGDSPVSQNGL